MQTLELERVAKSYNDKKVIDDMSFSIGPGEIFGLLGPNGAGKTTTLRMIDEPFSGLDPVNTELLKNILLDHRKNGKTIILSTHLMAQAEALCDRILMINNGKVVLHGKVDEIKKEHRHNSVILEFEGDGDALAGLDQIDRIIRHGTFVEIFLNEGEDMQSLLEVLVRTVRVVRFEPSTPSLNEIFIDIVQGAGS